MVSRAAIDFSSSWFDWFVRNRPTPGYYLKAGTNGTVSWQPALGGGTTLDNMVIASDYDNLQDAVSASCDVGKVLWLNCELETAASVPLTVDGSTILGIGRGYNGTAPAKLTATDAVATGVLDIRADGVTLSNFCIDVDSKAGNGLNIGDIDGTNVGDARCGVLQNLEIMNAASGAAIQWNDHVDYWTIVAVRMMTGHKYANYLNSPAGSVYDNGHLTFVGCEHSATYASLIRNAVAATFHRLTFLQCDFHDGHSNNYMVDTSNIHEARFYSCCFEANDGVNQGPDDAMVYLNSIGSGCWGCTFSFKDNTAGYDGVRADLAYDPYPLWNCVMENSVAAQHVEIIGTGATAVLSGLQSTYRNSCAGTATSNAVDLYDLVD